MRQTGPLWPLLVLFLATSFVMAACGSAETKAITLNLDIENRSLNQEEPVLRANQGDSVTISITSDENLRFHLHGYDIERDVGPGDPATFEFTANATGSFPFTIHLGPGTNGDAEDGHGDNDHSEGADGEIEVELGRLEVQPG